MNDNVFSSYSSCYKCEKRIKIEYYEDTCETKDNVTFMGDLGMEIYSYCPYCGVKHTGFRSSYRPLYKRFLYRVHQTD